MQIVSGSWFKKVVQTFTFKPDFDDYIKDKLKKRFEVKKMAKDLHDGEMNCYLEIPGGLTEKDKINTAKMFGLTMRQVKFRKIKDTAWRITFPPEGVQKIKKLISTFPNWLQQARTGKNVRDFEPVVEPYLTKEQKESLSRENRQIMATVVDVLNYLFSVPILSYFLRQMYWHRGKLGRIINKIPSNSDGVRGIATFVIGFALFYFFIYTFALWATVFCLLLAGYALRKIWKSVKVTTVT
jgi:hypothetical protein